MVIGLTTLMISCTSSDDKDKDVNLEEVAYVLSTTGTSIARIGDSNKSVSGLNASTKLLGIDYRPSNSLLYALGDDGQLYTIDSDGTANKIGTPQSYGGGLGTGIALDFNPQVDAIRVIITADGRNFVTNPVTGVPAEFTQSAYDASDTNSGVNPRVVATAYDNNVSPFPNNGTTIQHSFEARQNVFALQAKNAGTLTTIATLNEDVKDFAGFDISGATGNAYALLNINGTQTLYMINTTTGELTRLADDVAGFGDITIAPNDIQDAGPFSFSSTPASSYTRVDRMGMPAIATAVITSKDDYNKADPTEDAKLTFANEIVTNVNGFHTALDDDLTNAGLVPCNVDPNDPFNANTSKCITQAAPLVVPDIITIDTTTAAGFPNGRKLADPVMDVTLALVLLDLSAQGQSVTTLADLPLNPSANDKPFLANFPYLAPQH